MTPPLPGNTYTPDLGDWVWLDPRIRDLWSSGEFHDDPNPVFAPGAAVPVGGEITGVSWSSIDGAWVTVEYAADIRWPGATNEIGVDPGLVLHVPSSTFPGHDESGAV